MIKVIKYFIEMVFKSIVASHNPCFRMYWSGRTFIFHEFAPLLRVSDLAKL